MAQKSLTLTAARNHVLLEQILMVFVLGMVVFSVLLGLLYLGFRIRYYGQINPGVTVAGIYVGSLKPAAAAAKISLELPYHHRGVILLRDGDHTLSVTPAEMGLFLDPETTAENAFRVGRETNPLRSLAQQFGAIITGTDLPPVMIFDQRMAFEVLTRIARERDVQVVEPSLSVVNGEVIIHEGRGGRFLDKEATLALLGAQMQSLSDGVVPLVFREVKPLIISVSSQAELARNILSQPLKIHMPSGQPDNLGPWVFEPVEVGDLLVFKKVIDDEPRYELGLDNGKLYRWLSDLQPDLYLEPVNTRFIFNDDTRQLEVIQPAIIGRTLDIDASINALEEKVLAGEHNLNLEFIFTPPPVTDEMTAEQLGIRELVHREISYYYGSSAERIHNIRVSSERFHGLLVAPGETFSMVQALGQVSLESGFAEALIIMGGRTIQGVGGGICQVSTTLFRAAFFTGFPIIERHPHAYRVRYYEVDAANNQVDRLVGLDAAVFVPIVDLKFKNDTPHWLLMETYVNAPARTLTWKFYSTSDGRQVQWETTGPTHIVEAPKPIYRENPELAKGEVKQVDWEADGADVTVTRTVIRNGEVYFRDTIFTHYQPWQAIYEYGPGTEGMPPPDAENDDN